MSNMISVSPALTPPIGISQIISPSYAGFGIEPSNLYSYTGGPVANDLSLNLMKNLANYTGAPPHLRIGGNTGDYMIYDPSHDSYDVGLNTNAVGQGEFPTDHMIIGPRYFEVLNRLATGTPITYGLNMAYSEEDYLERIAAAAEAARSGLSNVDLVSFEIGNEPDLYLQNGFRTGEWGGEVYTREWLKRAEAINKRVLVPNGLLSNFFEPACTASTVGTTFQILDLESAGIADSRGSVETFVSSWNQHDYYYYIGVSTYSLTMEYFTDLSTTSTQFRHWVDQIEQAVDSGYTYALREMGVVGPIGMEGVTDTFAASLWALNFFLYTAGLNITSVQLHMTDNSNASAWQPIPFYGNEPFIRPIYYAFAAMAQLIGESCSTQMIGVPMRSFPATYSNRIAHYNTYRKGKLAAMVFINSKVANITDSKANLIIDILLPELSGEKLYLSYLTAEGADSTSGTTWNGISYEESGDGSPTIVNSDSDTVTVSSDGTVSVRVRDSQAVVANIGSVLGSSPTESDGACNLVSDPDSTPPRYPVSTVRSKSPSPAPNLQSIAVAKERRPWDVIILVLLAFQAAS